MTGTEPEMAARAPWAFQALSPGDFLVRTASVHPEKLAVVDGDWSCTYRQLADRAMAAAGAIRGLAAGRPVAVLAPNSHVLLEATFAVPWAASPLVALNIRLSPDELAWIIGHSRSAVLLYDHQFAGMARQIARTNRGLILVAAKDEYEELVAESAAIRSDVTDESSLLAINYTSGTTGRPKGVMYHHRGAYLQALAMVVHAGLRLSDKYLWTLPMFHCNGWCFPWAVTAVGATHVCLRKFDEEEVWRTIAEQGVTAFCAAPTVLTLLAQSPAARRTERPIRVMTGGAPPTPALIQRMENLNIEITHLYGLTETFGPAVVCEPQPGWEGMAADEKARRVARQGVGNLIGCRPRVIDPKTSTPVPADGETMGEITLRGNNVMLGYYDDPEATTAAIRDGWFHTGDLGVVHPDGYVELRDRSKDVIISGGENISSVQVESILANHPAVVECAVVAAPDDRWGEIPIAFVTLVPGAQLSGPELQTWAREQMAGFKVPKRVVFGDLPRTSTGKVQKTRLRDRARALVAEAEPGTGA